VTSRLMSWMRSAAAQSAKVLHWTMVALLLVQYLIGWLMPDIHRDTKPGIAMTFHVSVGLTILSVIVLRFVWRVTHPVFSIFGRNPVFDHLS
jgi:cytochrome b561